MAARQLEVIVQDPRIATFLLKTQAKNSYPHKFMWLRVGEVRCMWLIDDDAWRKE